jgi:hypothetical protein
MRSFIKEGERSRECSTHGVLEKSIWNLYRKPWENNIQIGLEELEWEDVD